MPIDPANTWGGNIATAISGLGITDSAQITPSQLALVWTTVKTEDKTQLGKAAVAAGTLIDSVAGPVSGVGGPVT